VHDDPLGSWLLAESLAKMPGACQSLRFERAHLPGLLGRSREQKPEIGAGRDIARTHLDELGGQLRLRRKAADAAPI